MSCCECCGQRSRYVREGRYGVPSPAAGAHTGPHEDRNRAYGRYLQRQSEQWWRRSWSVLELVRPQRLIQWIQAERWPETVVMESRFLLWSVELHLG